MGKKAGRPELAEAYVARIVPSDDGDWRAQPLVEHLQNVGELAATFASAFGAGDWARIAGRLHDLGKYQSSWQDYIRRRTGYWTDAAAVRRGSIDHAAAGAIHAIDQLGPIGRLIAYPIAGHHGGLADWYAAPEAAASGLQGRLAKRDTLQAAMLAPVPRDVVDAGTPDPPRFATTEGVHLWIRMLFSCLVDADSLDTERFHDGNRPALRDSWRDLTDVLGPLEDYLSRLPRRGPIDDLRTEIRHQAVKKATDAPGVFSLTVPTGGGKTLTSLDFAIRHALHYSRQRVIYAIPYVSIIEQTADEFRKVFEERFVVLEHHANLDPDQVPEESEAAAENWAAPIVVTTTVQLFESLFGAGRGRSRKLHNIANSVLVLDEVQLLPPQFLAPIAAVLRELVRAYGVTVVLSTATQPALGTRDEPDRRFKGFTGVRELMDDSAALWPRLERVVVEWPIDLSDRSDWTDVASSLQTERQVLCVVNSRADCRDLVALLPDDTVHLSALMCAEHRSRVIGHIKARLSTGDLLRVVSTQLVEAGVDIDFPVVFRALAGLDSIAQSAGRCNREGRASRGRVVVFVPPKPAPMGHLRKAEQATRALLSTLHPNDLLTPAGFERYFELLYASSNLDEAEIVPLLTEGARRGEIPFRTVSSRFQMVSEDGAATILVPYGEGAGLLDQLERSGPERWLLRRLQRFSVTVHPGQLAQFQGAGDVREIQPGLFALTAPNRYDERLGLLLGDTPLVLEGLLA